MRVTAMGAMQKQIFKCYMTLSSSKIFIPYQNVLQAHFRLHMRVGKKEANEEALDVFLNKNNELFNFFPTP
jgi:hypothetical protein